MKADCSWMQTFEKPTFRIESRGYQGDFESLRVLNLLYLSLPRNGSPFVSIIFPIYTRDPEYSAAFDKRVLINSHAMTTLD